MFGASTHPASATWHGKEAVEALHGRGTYEGLRRAYDAALYNVQPTGRANNQAHGLDVEFASTGVLLEHSHGALQMRLAGYGYGERLNKPVAGPTVVEGNRVEYRRGDVTEWYINEATGLEQGFTISRPPGTQRAGQPLVLALETAGLIPDLEGTTGTVLLRAANGQTVLRYSGLKSWDARGHLIPGRMEVSGRQVRLVVEDASAEYPLTVDPVFTQQAKLTAADGAANDSFGTSVALSGDTALIGAPGNAGSRGAAYVFVRTGSTWTWEGKLTANDGVAGDLFGWSVALSGDAALVGAYQDDGGKGSAYVFVRSGTAWSQQAKLMASDGVALDRFGVSVSLSGDTALVGANQDDSSRGSAYVFVRTGTVWIQQGKLTAADGAANDSFGISVSISGETALVGANQDDSSRGSAYIFVRTGTTWQQQAKLGASDGVASDEFGRSVSLSGTTALIGAFRDDTSKGSAYVFLRSGSSWGQQAKLTASDGLAGDAFGFSVALNGDFALIGANADDSGRGGAYLFGRSGVLWTQQLKLTAPDGVAGDAFGAAVAVSSDTSLVGASGDDNTSILDQGSAYVFAGALNDELLDATIINSLPYRATQNTRFATTAATDPAHSCNGNVKDRNTIWFRYVATFTGKLLVNTFGSDYDTILTAYPGTTSSGAELACNDQVGGTNQSRVDFNVVAGQSYLIEASSYDFGGGPLVLNVDRADVRIGIIRGSTWYLDMNANGAFDNGSDKAFDWSAGEGSTYVSGDWNGDGKSKAGFFKNGLWYLDYNGNGVWEPAIDKLYGFGWTDPCVVPVTGDWNGDGRTKVGVFCNGFWYLDYDGSGAWDPFFDALYGWGWNGVTPLVGDWNGDKRSKIGFFVNGLWYLDYDGNGLWQPQLDRQYGWGWNGVVPLVGDWSGDGTSKIGFYINGFWYLDYNGNGIWEPGADRLYSWGWSGVTPMMGDWNGDGRTKIGIFINGFWYLDFSGDGIWNGAPPDRLYGLGQAGDLPTVGRW